MNRTDQKCILASACGHGLLLVVVVFGVGFFPRAKEAPVSVLTMVQLIPPDAIITDGATRGGGNPNVTTMPAAGSPAAAPVARPEPPPPRPVPPTPTPTRREPDPTPAPPRPTVKKDSFSLPSEAKKLKKLPTKSTAATKNTGKTKAPVKSGASTDSEAKAARETQRQLLNSALAGIAGGTSKGVGVEIPGPGGQAFINYRDLILSAYKRRFDRELESAGTSLRGGLTVDVAITITRDGQVVHRTITRSSGVRVLDEAVRRVIEAVQEIAPFPAEAKDARRTFNVTFEPRVDRLAG